MQAENPWNPPRVEEENLNSLNFDAARTGLMMTLISVNLYAAALWVISGFLHESGIVDGRLTWRQSAGTCLLVSFCRMWNRVFFQ
jgi:hypothetical protein